MKNHPFLFVLIILCFTQISFSQDVEAITKDGKRVVLKSDKTWEFAKETLSTPIKETLPPNFPGDDFPVVLQFLSTKQKEFKKSEFETESQYKKRLWLLADTTKIPQLDKNINELVFVTLPDLKYSAESQTFRFNTSYFTLPKKILNGYVLAGESGMIFSKNLTSTISFAMKAEQAANLKEKLYLAVYGTPVSEIKGSNIIDFWIYKLQIFDYQTGQVYFTQDFEDFKPRDDRLKIN